MSPLANEKRPYDKAPTVAKAPMVKIIQTSKYIHIICLLLMPSLQCHSMGNISGEARERWRRELLGGSGGMLSQKILKSRGLECYFQHSPRAICDLRIS